MSPGSISPAVGSTAADPVRFDGPRGELLLLLIKNFFLNLVTLGIYRFWARTHVRAYFWRNVAIDGEPLEYIGRGLELFIGFLIVYGILVSVVIPFSILQLVFAGYGTIVDVTVQVAYVGVLFILLQIAVFRARRYRLTRTIWRGVRCGQDGEWARYLGISVVYSILSFVTLGFAHPWRKIALHTYLMNNTRFGRQHFQFKGAGWDLFRYKAIALVARYAIIALIVVLNYDIVMSIIDFYSRALRHEDMTGFAFTKTDPVYWPLALLVVSLALDIWYLVKQHNYLIAHTSFGEISLGSTLKTPAVVWYLLVYAVLVIVGYAATVGVFAAIIGFSTFGGAGEPSSALIFLVLFPAIFLFFGMIGLAKVAWLHYQLLRAICRQMSVDNLAFVERVVQQADDGVRYGEGLADALDYDALDFGDF